MQLPIATVVILTSRLMIMMRTKFYVVPAVSVRSVYLRGC